MPTYTFSFPASALGKAVTIRTSAGVTVDTVAAGASSGAVSVVTSSPPQGAVVVTSTLDIGEYAAVAEDARIFYSAHATGVLDVPASLQELPDTFAPVAVSGSGMAAPFDGAHPRIVKPLSTSIFEKGNTTAQSMMWPYLVDNIIGGGTGWSLFYSTDHASHAQSGIFRATAETPLQQFTNQGLVYRDDAGGAQTETGSVVWDEVEEEWLLYYQQVKSPGGVGVGVQSTLYATSPDLTNWTRQGLCAEMVRLTDAGDGHTGYFMPFDLGGLHYAYSMYGSGYRGRFALWRSLNRRKWIPDLSKIATQMSLLRDVSVDGAVMSTPADPPTGDVNSTWPKLFQGSVITWRGALWWIGIVGPRAAGGDEPVGQRVCAAPLRSDLLGFSASPIDITPPSQPWETTDIQLLGNTVTFEGRTLIPYRVNSSTGKFGIMEVI